MVLLYQIIQVSRRAQLRVRRERAIGLQPAHRTVWCGVPVQRDCLQAPLLAFDRFYKRMLWRPRRRAWRSAESRPFCPPDNGTIQVALLASDLEVCLVDPPWPTDCPGKATPAFLELRRVALRPAIMVVCAIHRPRSAIISTRSRSVSLNRRYQCAHRMTNPRSKWRPWTALRRSTACSLPTSTNSARQRSRSARAICTRAGAATSHGRATWPCRRCGYPELGRPDRPVRDHDEVGESRSERDYRTN